MPATAATEPTGRASRRRLVVLAIVAILVLVGLQQGAAAACGAFRSAMDTEQHARDRAATAVRERARQTRAEIQGVLRNTAAGISDQDLLTKASVAAEEGGAQPATVFSRQAQAGRIRLDVAFVAQGEAGGGLDYQSVIVRLCARFEGVAGPATTVTLRDTPCDPGLPRSVTGIGTIDETVTLSD